MGRYSERAVYLGFGMMCLFQRLDMMAPAALCHDVTTLVLGFGLFVEGIRLTQLPQLITFFYTQLAFGGARLANLEVLEVGLALSIALMLLYGEPGYERAPTTGPYEVGFKEFVAKGNQMWNDCSVYYPVDRDLAEKY